MELMEAKSALYTYNNPMAAARAFRRGLDMLMQAEDDLSRKSKELVDTLIHLASLYMDYSSEEEKATTYWQVKNYLTQAQQILDSAQGPVAPKLRIEFLLVRGQALFLVDQQKEAAVAVWEQGLTLEKEHAGVCGAIPLSIQVGTKCLQCDTALALQYAERGVQDLSPLEQASHWKQFASRAADQKVSVVALAAGQKALETLQEVYQEQQNDKENENNDQLTEGEEENDVDDDECVTMDDIINTIELLGTFHRESGDLPKSIELYKQALHERQKAADAGMKDDDGADFFLSAASATLHNSLGFSQQEHGDDAAAVETLQKSLEIFQECGLMQSHQIYVDLEKSYYALGASYKKLKQVDKALECTRKAISFQEQLGQLDLAAGTRTSLIDLCTEHDMVQEAHELRLELFDMYWRHRGGDENAPYPEQLIQLCDAIGKYHKSNDNMDQALLFLKRASIGWKQHAPQSAEYAFASLAVGTTLSEMGCKEEALECFQEASTVAKARGPDENAKLCLSMALYNIANTIHALSVTKSDTTTSARDANDGNDDDTKETIDKVKLATALSPAEEAVAMMKEQVNLASHLPRVLFTLGTIHEDLGNKDQALVVLKESLERLRSVDPQSDFATTIEERIQSL